MKSMLLLCALVTTPAVANTCFQINDGQELQYVHRWKLAMIPSAICVQDAESDATLITVLSGKNVLASLNASVSSRGRCPGFCATYQIDRGLVQGRTLDLRRGDEVRYAFAVEGGQGSLTIHEVVVGSDLQSETFAKELSLSPL